MAAVPAEVGNPHRNQLAALTLTEAELRFVDLLTARVPPNEAAQLSGVNERASRVIKRPAVQAALREATWVHAQGVLLPHAAKALQDVLSEPEYSGAAKVAAVKLVWSAVGILRNEPKTRELRENPVGEAPEGADVQPIGVTADSLRNMQAMLSSMHARLTAAEPIDVTPVGSAAPSPIDL